MTAQSCFVVVCLFASSPVFACAAVAPAGVPVRIDEEEAILVWDAQGKKEHFIRRASFRTQAKDFGFLVPTPSVPELAEADDEVFADAARLTAPAVVEQKVQCKRPSGREMAKSAAPAAAPPPAPVTLVREQKVAGYDAAVLQATDGNALNNWLKEHGYVSSPELAAWSAPYISNGWKITAFKIGGGDGVHASPHAVRMSFAAERPYFPYREPQAKQADGVERLLRVYFIATDRAGGLLGGEAWQADTVWSNTIDDAQRDRLLKRVKLERAFAQKAWLTEFEDRASPRPGRDEVFFERAADQSTVKRPDQIVQSCEYSGPEPDEEGRSFWRYVTLAAALVAAAFGYRRLRRSR